MNPDSSVALTNLSKPSSCQTGMNLEARKSFSLPSDKTRKWPGRALSDRSYDFRRQDGDATLPFWLIPSSLMEHKSCRS